MKTFRKLREEFDVCPNCKQDPCVCDDSFGFVNEDGGAAGLSAGPSNVVGTGAIAGTGGKGGEPGVDMRKRKKHYNPIMMSMGKRKAPK